MKNAGRNFDDIFSFDQGRPASSILDLIRSENPQIATFTAVEYIDPPSIQDRIPNIEQTDLFKKALSFRSSTLLPFWDSALTQTLKGATKFRSLIQSALFHNSSNLDTHKIEADLAEEQLSNLLSRNRPKTTLALSSAVLADDGSSWHIPMLDFHIPSNFENLEIVIESLKSLNAGKFIVVNSGKSFHAYGSTLLNTAELTNFLARSLLLSPIIDSRYIAHQIIDNQCKLRIEPTPRKPTSPLVVGIA